MSFDPGEGEVFWSDRSGQFYQRGRRGAVSREEAKGFLRYDRESGNYLDQRGNAVPSQAIESPLRRDIKSFKFTSNGERVFSAETVYDRISKSQAQNITLAENEWINVKTTIRTPDGRIITSEYRTRFGKNLDPQFDDLQVARRASRDLQDQGYQINTGQVGNSTIFTEYERTTLRRIR